MPVQRVFTGQNHLDDPEVARQLGARLWEEGDLQLDFSDIASVTPAFATEVLALTGMKTWPGRSSTR
jgi:hypothetical protein